MIPRPLYLPLATTAAIALLCGAFWTIGNIQGAAKLAEVEAVRGSRLSVAVTLRFAPEGFHMKLIQDIGRVQKVDGSTVFLVDAKSAGIKDLAQRYWVARIRPWAPTP